jgi:putative tryptophan/tyrosine transport system substrate-binding protein
MKRRAFVMGMGAALTAALPSGLRSQRATRRVGALIGASGVNVPSFEDELTRLGWKIGQTLKIEYRFGGGDTTVTRAQARELLALDLDVLFVQTNTAMAAVHAEHTSVPIVFAMVSDPIGMHYVESFAHPGGNVTGFTPFEPSLGGKWLSTLKEIAPHIEHIGLIYNPEPGNNAGAFRKAIDEIATQLKIASIENPAGDSTDIERLITDLGKRPNSGLIFLPDSLTSDRREQMVALVNRNRMPAIYPLRNFCTAGGLISYGVDISRLIRGAAAYVDRILRGARPSELPVQAPTQFELVVNQKTARLLGLQLPPTMLARADEVIE